MTRRVAAHHHRGAARRRRRDAALAAQPAPAREAPQERLLRTQSIDRLLDRLGTRTCAAWEMFELLGMSGPEIASELGLPLNTLYSRVRLARTQLQRALAEPQLERLIADERAEDVPPERAAQRGWQLLLPALGGTDATVPTLLTTRAAMLSTTILAVAVVVLAPRSSPPAEPPTHTTRAIAAPPSPPRPPGAPTTRLGPHLRGSWVLAVHGQLRPMLSPRLRLALLLPAVLLPACTDDGSNTVGLPSTSVGLSSGDSSGVVTTGTGTGQASTPTTSGSPTGDSATSQTSSSTTTVADTTGTTTDASSSSTGEPVCPEGTVVCDGGNSQVCDGLGGFKEVQVCADVCLEGVGCKLCKPGTTSCDGDKVMLCDNVGDSEMPVETCDGVQGVVCDPNAGKCTGACAPELLALSYIGCDYYPTVTQQFDLHNTSPEDNYAVAVANTSDKEVKITVTRGAMMVTQTTVGANTVKIVQLPWVDELTKGSGPSVLVKTGAYRLRTDGPVTIYQYNPLAATTTNDASLLLPVNTWTGNYLVASWQSGFYAVTASQDNTKVTLSPSATGKLVQAGGGVAANGTGVVMLNSGDVLEVIAQLNFDADVTGTLVNADKPVQVIGGHECANVPANISACDHLEESMFPIETLAKEYLVVPTVQVPMDTKDKAQVVRIIASEANTTLVFSPDQPVGKFLVNAGDFVELGTSTAKFLVTADKKIMVAQYLIGQDGGFGESDPSMLLAVNPQEWRKSYVIHAPTSWSANYIDFMAQAGANVTLDGVAVGGWQPIGATGYSVTHAKLSNLGDGNHTIASDVGVGVAVTGVQDNGSYWYPGGLDLDVIPQ